MNSQKPTVNNQNTLKRRKITNQKKSKGIIFIFFLFIIGTTALCLALLAVMSSTDSNQPQRGTTYLFHEPDYDLNIFELQEYLELDRTVKFENPDNGITYAIIDGNMDEVPTIMQDSVRLLCNFIDYAIKGESDMLNSLFSEEYIEASGKTKMDFTMQQLYNIKITYVTSTSETIDGFTTESYDFWLEYMIRNNNGTFRNDMESDSIKKEYVRVTSRNGILGIDVLAPYNTEPQPNTVLNGSRLVIAFAASAVIVGLACIGGTFIVKKSRCK